MDAPLSRFHAMPKGTGLRLHLETLSQWPASSIPHEAMREKQRGLTGECRLDGFLGSRAAGDGQKVVVRREQPWSVGLGHLTCPPVACADNPSPSKQLHTGVSRKVK
ncbi:hypothetical protein CYMTET_22248 [Cymbomonas tetramitiformis]|uniref:Uncharacterized protein n=1 Tax=Cymbomonas tetramitiformis TaxID=36881 RepID=A0AAE0G0J6_9CHLO|nr:hypothetical protein CYMTET_22248 [Cymbomonas tetramitiformis]